MTSFFNNAVLDAASSNPALRSYARRTDAHTSPQLPTRPSALERVLCRTQHDDGVTGCQRWVRDVADCAGHEDWPMLTPLGKFTVTETLLHRAISDGFQLRTEGVGNLWESVCCPSCPSGKSARQRTVGGRAAHQPGAFHTVVRPACDRHRIAEHPATTFVTPTHPLGWLMRRGGVRSK